MTENNNRDYFTEFVQTLFSHPNAAMAAFFVTDMTIIRWFLALFDSRTTSFLIPVVGSWIQNVPTSFIISTALFWIFWAYLAHRQNRVRLSLDGGESVFRIRIEGLDSRQLEAYEAWAFICYRRSIGRRGRSSRLPFYKFPLPGEFFFSKTIPFVAEFPILQEFFKDSPQVDADVDPQYSVFVTLRVQGEFFRIEKQLTLSRSSA